MKMTELDDELLNAYEYAADPALREHLHARDITDIRAMLAYGRGVTGFGRQMMAHQNRTGHDGANFLRFLGFSERAARNFRAGMIFHDIGKTHSSYPLTIWTLDDRPTPEEKILQKKHARFGAEMFGVSAAAIKDHPHFAVRRAVTLYHHERIDGGGPEKTDAAALPVFAQVSCIIDAYDGDRIQRPHQSARRTPEEALRRLAGIGDPKGKYTGAFDPALIRRYIEFKERELGISTDII
jgi:response regulator RpfG family c-di-GMP phosphodiesterase